MQAFEVGIAVGFARAVVPVIVAKRREVLQPFVDIGDQTILGIVDVNSRCDVHGRHEYHAFADAAFGQRRLHLRGDVYVFPVFLGAEGEVFGVKPHTQDNSHARVPRLTWFELDMVRPGPSDFMYMRAAGLCALLFVAVCVSLPAQEPALPSTPETPPVVGAPDVGAPVEAPQDPRQPALTPEQQREQQIRQFDPLDPGADKDEQDKEKAARDAQKKARQGQAPTPGSIAAETRDNTPSGPRVTEGDTGDQPVQEYTGPAVLSRSYSVNRPLIPQQLKWTESAGVNAVYNNGVSQSVSANGTPGNATIVGTQINWGFSGRHYFRRDQIAVNYTGNYYQYGGASAFNGANNTLAVDYGHVISSRLKLNVSATGVMYSQSFTLEAPSLGPDTTIANINLGISPNIQVTDYGTKQFTTQADLTWQKSARLSFSGGVSYFAVVRDAPGLLGATGDQARGDVDYRLTSRMTVGGYYSYNHYIFSQGFGTSGTNTVGGIYSYAFSRSMQLRLRGGVSQVESIGFQTITVAPALAALLGQGTGIIDSNAKTTTSDISAQFIKDFRGGRTASVAFAHGISPGNGIFMTSEQESISATFAMPFRRVYTIQGGVGRDTLTSVGFVLGNYESDYGRLSIARRFSSGMSVNFSGEIRHFDITELVAVRNQLRISTGISWGSTNGRLWPF